VHEYSFLLGSTGCYGAPRQPDCDPSWPPATSGHERAAAGGAGNGVGVVPPILIGAARGVRRRGTTWLVLTTIGDDWHAQWELIAEAAALLE
jgi:hypothetical protein